MRIPADILPGNGKHAGQRIFLRTDSPYKKGAAAGSSPGMLRQRAAGMLSVRYDKKKTAAHFSCPAVSCLLLYCEKHAVCLFSHFDSRISRNRHIIDACPDYSAASSAESAPFVSSVRLKETRILVSVAFASSTTSSVQPTVRL